MIEGVLIEPLKVFTDMRGSVKQMLRCDAPFFKKFGEIYFSFTNPGVIKGWKKHLRQTQHFAVPIGELKLVLYDNRSGSSTQGQIQEIIIGGENYNLIRIPPQIWYSFKALGNELAMITNCTDIPHDPSEAVQIELCDKSVPFSWE